MTDMSRNRRIRIGILSGIAVVLLIIFPELFFWIKHNLLLFIAAAGTAFAVVKGTECYEHKTGRDIGRKKKLIFTVAAGHIAAVLLINTGDMMFSSKLTEGLSMMLCYTGRWLLRACIAADIVIAVRFFASKNVRKRGITNTVAVLITLVIHLLIVWTLYGGENSGAWEGLGYLVLFLFFGGIGVVIDTIWLVRGAKCLIRRGIASKRLFALLTLMLHLVLLASLYATDSYVGFIVFGISLVMCGVLDIVWLIHGIKKLFSRHR